MLLFRSMELEFIFRIKKHVFKFFKILFKRILNYSMWRLLLQIIHRRPTKNFFNHKRGWNNSSKSLLVQNEKTGIFVISYRLCYLKIFLLSFERIQVQSDQLWSIAVTRWYPHDECHGHTTSNETKTKGKSWS